MSSRKQWVVRIIGAIAIIGLIGFLVIQFLPIRPRTNPPIVEEPAWDSQETRALMERACYDCHSNETKWPAYAYVAPVSWLIVGEVNHGRHELNFSRWGTGENEIDEAVELILDNEMPPRQYLLLHPEAQLNEAEVEQLIAGIRATFGPGEGDEYGEENEADEGDERAYGDEEYEEYEEEDDDD